MKYVGGKNKIGKYIANVIKEMVPPTMTSTYLEPFCGSLGVTVNMIDTYNKIYASDNHPDLIALWEAVQKNEFIPPTNLNETEWNIIKNKPSPSAMKAFVGFGCSFGGKYFSGYAQKYTNGKNEDYLKAATNSINKIQPKIQNIKFKCCDYQYWKPKNVVIYCDPPYNYNNFPVKYRKSTKKYDVFDNNKFWDIMRKWSKDNFVFISETKAPNDFISIWNRDSYRSASQSKKTRYKHKSTKKYNTEHLFIHKSLLNMK